MRVHIGKYKYWWGPYQIADLLQKVGVSEDTCHEIGKKLSKTKLNDLCNWIDSKRKRKVKVQVDPWDSWSADSTLALVILPVLKQLRSQLHGAPFTDDADVPDELKSTSAPPKENEYDTDDFHFKRWEWILDEIIWTFEQLVDEDWEAQYHTGNIEFQFVPCEDNPNLTEMKRGPNDTSSFDKEGWQKHDDRIRNGLILFGKYYRNLWD